MKYRVVLIESEGGFAVQCPMLPGCWSQGATRAEALDNIRDAIREYLEVREELAIQEAEADGSAAQVCEVELAPA